MMLHNKIVRYILCALLLMVISTVGFAQENTVGLIFNDSTASYDGYTLFTPISSTKTYLIDNEGYLIHSWESSFRPGQAVMLLENGNLLRTASVMGNYFNAGGSGGRVEIIDWDGNLIWFFDYNTSDYSSHHDVEILPNGNILLISWEKKSFSESVSAGRIPNSITGEIWSEKIVEIKPQGTSGGELVWEWHAWDHLIQDYDSSKPNYGNPDDRPELINLNYYSQINKDWLHINSVRYNSGRDEILLSVHNFNEVWIIDHSTTSEEASLHLGGNSGKGGDLLYRWGNPAAYDKGSVSDKKLFAQHDARWIAGGAENTDKLLLFNNGQGRPQGNYSSVDEISIPLDSEGKYFLNENGTFDPSDVGWSYTSDPATDFFAQNISGATRMPNGNTLICSGPKGKFFEVDSLKNVVWEYVNPVTADGIAAQGDTPNKNLVFKIYRYAKDYSAFDGKDMSRKGKIEIYITAVENNNTQIEKFSLEQNYPNPFNPTTKIKFVIPSGVEGKVTLKVYDILGNRVATLIDESKGPGSYVAEFGGSNLPSGIYFYRLNIGDKFSLAKKMLLLK